MPKITKQKARPAKRVSRGKGVLDRIAPVGEDTDGVKINIYGRGKTGKTRLACTFPKPLLLIGTEKGTKSVAGTKGLDFVQLSASGELDEIVEMLAGGKYRTAAIDTVGGLQQIILKEVLGLDDIPVQKSWGMAEQHDWQICGAQVKERMRGLLNLSETIGLHVPVIAHERNFNDEGGGSDLITPTVGSAVTPSVAGWLNGACDYVCQTFIREEVTQKVLMVGKKKAVTKQKTGRMEYCLRVGPHPVYLTGFRVPVGQILPDEIVDPNYDKIARLIQGE